MTNAKSRTKRAGLLPVLLIALAGTVILVIALQQVFAVQVGRLLAGVWVSTVGAVMGLIGALFGAH